MQHHFNVSVATAYGVNCAIILDNIYYWIEKNRANEVNYYDGYYWTFNSKKALAELFPYLTERQIRTAIDTLVDNEILITGNYNKLKLDRTLWYTITEKGYAILGEKSQFDLPSKSNAVDGDVKAIPNNKHTYNKPNNIGPDEPNFSTSPHSGVLVENKKEDEEVVGRGTAARPKRNYIAKPLVDVEVENKKLTRQQKQQVKIRELLQQVVDPVYGPELYNILGEYLDMRINLHIGKVDREWFQKEWDENIYPAIQKYSITEIVTHIRTVVIPKQYKRCFINISNYGKQVNFNDTGTYTATELNNAEIKGRLAIEQAKRDGTYRCEF